jgi:hypothetical protein
MRDQRVPYQLLDRKECNDPMAYGVVTDAIVLLRDGPGARRRERVRSR